MDFARLWLHEASRVYGDKMIDTKDMENFKKMKFEICKQFFDVSVQNIVATLGTSMTMQDLVCVWMYMYIQKTFCVHAMHVTQYHIISYDVYVVHMYSCNIVRVHFYHSMHTKIVDALLNYELGYFSMCVPCVCHNFCTSVIYYHVHVC